MSVKLTRLFFARNVREGHHNIIRKHLGSDMIAFIVWWIKIDRRRRNNCEATLHIHICLFETVAIQPIGRHWNLNFFAWLRAIFKQKQ